MSDSNNMWPFQEISAEEGLDINEIFGTGTSSGAAAPEANPFQVPQQAVPAPEAATPRVEQPPSRRACTQQSAGSSFRGKDRGERQSQPF